MFLLVQETLHSMNKSKGKVGWLILKLDIRKAFDSISWSFILKILKALNLPPQWISLIDSCFLNMDYTPTINDIKLDPLKLEKGIRQGDPLSPYFFILTMEYLSTLISTNVNQNKWKPFKVNNFDFKTSHLLFVDDILLFAKAYNYIISSIKLILYEFCKVRRMKINHEKSTLWLSPSIPNDRKNYISNSLQISNTSSLGTSLGYPLKPKCTSSDFNYILHKIQIKLQDWKMNFLSLADRS